MGINRQSVQCQWEGSSTPHKKAPESQHLAEIDCKLSKSFHFLWSEREIKSTKSTPNPQIEHLNFDPRNGFPSSHSTGGTGFLDCLQGSKVASRKLWNLFVKLISFVPACLERFTAFRLGLSLMASSCTLVNVFVSVAGGREG